MKDLRDLQAEVIALTNRANTGGDKGEKGDPGIGTQGPAGVGIPGVGIQGPSGAAGYDAYTLAVLNGFTGSLEDWLASLQGGSGTNTSSGYAELEYHDHGFIDLDYGALFALGPEITHDSYLILTEDGYYIGIVE